MSNSLRVTTIQLRRVFQLFNTAPGMACLEVKHAPAGAEWRHLSQPRGTKQAADQTVHQTRRVGNPTEMLATLQHCFPHLKQCRKQSGDSTICVTMTRLSGSGKIHTGGGGAVYYD